MVKNSYFGTFKAQKYFVGYRIKSLRELLPQIEKNKVHVVIYEEFVSEKVKIETQKKTEGLTSNN